ncbi:transcriptional regulator [Desulforamulus ferrireducens]|uniref:Transcriptional regulator n=1 Tax=Desulforamulus ferrireducens TaxID=1833852 RepID=A0A1S6IZB8_9FIRM|nr:transcriptional regulator [Desulforamulus ferrireducens]AQS60119.1 transcriptional regulator [Desulforamulus ferrireducens]
MAKNIYNKVEELLELRKISVQELASRTMLEVSDIEGLKQFNPKKTSQLAIVQAISLALGINVYYFLGDDVIGPKRILSRLNVFDQQKLMNGELAPFIRISKEQAKKGLTDAELDALIQVMLEQERLQDIK